VRREHHDAHEPDRRVLLEEVGEGTDHDLVEVLTGPEQKPALEGAAGDLDQRTSFGDVSRVSGHLPI